MPLVLTNPEVETISYNQVVITKITNNVAYEQVVIEYIILKDGETNPVNKYEENIDGELEKVHVNLGEYTNRRYVANGKDNIKAIYNDIQTEVASGLVFEEASKKVLYSLLGTGSVN